MGRIEKEEIMVYQSVSREVFGFAASLDGGRSQDTFHSRYDLSMSDALYGNTREGCIMLRIVRRSLFERAKFLELEVGDIPLLTGISMIDEKPSAPTNASVS